MNNAKVVTEIRVECQECGTVFRVLSNFKGLARCYCSKTCANRYHARKWYRTHKADKPG